MIVCTCNNYFKQRSSKLSRWVVLLVSWVSGIVRTKQKGLRVEACHTNRKTPIEVFVLVRIPKILTRLLFACCLPFYTLDVMMRVGERVLLSAANRPTFASTSDCCKHTLFASAVPRCCLHSTCWHPYCVGVHRESITRTNIEIHLPFVIFELDSLCRLLWQCNTTQTFMLSYVTLASYEKKHIHVW